jgi:hypothetical protein
MSKHNSETPIQVGARDKSHQMGHKTLLCLRTTAGKTGIMVVIIVRGGRMENVSWEENKN